MTAALKWKTNEYDARNFVPSHRSKFLFDFYRLFFYSQNFDLFKSYMNDFIESDIKNKTFNL